MLTYPSTEKSDVVDSYFGQSVPDAYRWLENDTSEATAAWVKAQNEVTFSYLNGIPGRNEIRVRLEELWNFPKRTSPYQVGEYYFFGSNDGLQNQYVIMKQKGLEGEPEVFLDPNTVNPEGTTTLSISGYSKDGKYVTIDRSDAGSDWSALTIKEVESGKVLPETLEWVKFSGASWKEDGFYYSRYPAPKEGTEYSATNKDHMVYYHKVGTPQSEDELVYRNAENPSLYHWVNVTEDERYLILYAASGTDGYECYFKDLSAPNSSFKPLFTGFKNKSSVIDHHNGRFLVITDIDAPNYRLVSIAPDKTDKSSWKEVIPESEHLLERVSTGGGKLFLNYLEKACNKLYVAEMDGTNRTSIELPGAGSSGGIGGEKDEEVLFYSYTSFNYPTSIFKYDVKTGKSTLFYQPEVSFKPEDFESKQVTYTSTDGTEVTMFIVKKKDVLLDGNNPCLLYGYGGFNISITPSFSISNIVFLERGGVYAVANLRGGGEYGEEWHKAGMLLKKQNVFDDFISAAEYLVDEGYTSSDRLAIEGRSNGGLLVGAVMTQRPELFAVAFPGVGVMDMLRYHRFTVGWGWIPEYGSADSSEVDFKNLFGYSPLHNLELGIEYPATMVTTADHDDRVVPAHSFKFAARLQECHAGPEPVLIRIDVNAGHGAGKPTSMVLDEIADKWAFLFENVADGAHPN
jgi:prolyl oligopeptidase